MALVRQSDCVFCQIVDQTVDQSIDQRIDQRIDAVPDGAAALHPSSGVVFADDVAVAFLDRSPLFPGHTLVVPRDHVVTLADLPVDGVGPLFERVQLIARAMPIATGKPGVFIANNNIVSQSVAHLHVHVVPRQRGDGLRGFFWPRTRYAEGEADELVELLRSAIDEIDDSVNDPKP